MRSTLRGQQSERPVLGARRQKGVVLLPVRRGGVVHVARCPAPMVVVPYVQGHLCSK